MKKLINMLPFKLNGVVVALVITFGALVATTVTASPAAAGSTYLWNDVRGSVQVYYLPNVNYSNYFNVPNGERFVMNCWLDNAGNRWFYGQTWNHGWGYVTANWVINQTVVGPC